MVCYRIGWQLAGLAGRKNLRPGGKTYAGGILAKEQQQNDAGGANYDGILSLLCV
jgi:hypothetical protein